jgi:hypothetical protein
MSNKSVVFLFCLFGTIANAQEIPGTTTVNKKVVCTDTKSLFENIKDSKYKEQPVWVGRLEDSTMTIFANNETGTWTLIQFNSDVACVVDAGEDSRFFIGSKGSL